MRVGDDGAVIVADVRGEQQPPQAGLTTHVVKVRVADVDAAFERARAHGARVLEEPTEFEYGERECTRRGPRRAPLAVHADDARRRPGGVGRRDRRALKARRAVLVGDEHGPNG